MHQLRRALVSSLGLLILSTAAHAAIPATIDLNGQWSLRQSGKDEAVPATVPGNVHTDLLAAGKIPDPFHRDNEEKLQWIGAATWIYSRSFDVPASLLELRNVVLRCEGLDTIAEVRVNGKKAGFADNMFRVWEFDVRELLKPGKNLIEVTFLPAQQWVNDHMTDPAFPGLGSHKTSNLRKEACDFGWDWGPNLATCGIWRNIGLVGWNNARLDGVRINQDLTDKAIARLDIDVAVATDGSIPLKSETTVTFDGREIARASQSLRQRDGVGRTTIEIKDPQLWWPTGMGRQNLYEVRVAITDETGAPIGETTKRIGLRTIEWLAKTDSRPLGLSVNGRPFFAKGANWIPPDTFTSRITPDLLRRYMADAAAANMNMMRLWGGGYYEEDELFDICDELGILIWFDFKFACAAYPAWDPAFRESVRAELRDNIERLRHHPSIAVWCGNNEVRLFYFTGDRSGVGKMSYAEYDHFFGDLIGGTLKDLAPQAIYTPGSPEAGDEHFWGVWHGNQPYEAYEDLHGMQTEFGFQSFPHPRTVESFTSPEDRASIFSPVMKAHQKAGPQGNEKISRMIERYFRAPKDFDSTIWVSQISQAYGILKGVDHWRRDWPHSTGSLVWQYNDTWPGATWSMVDYFGRKKPLLYRLRDAYAPVRVSGVASREGAVSLYVATDRATPINGKLRWLAMTTAGKTLKDETLDIKVPAGTTSTKVGDLSLAPEIAEYGTGGVIVWLTLTENDTELSRNIVLFDKPKNIDLIDPEIKTDVSSDGGNFLVTLTSAHPALWTWIDLKDADATYSDNFVDLRPGSPVTISVTPAKLMSLEEFRAALQVRNLYDTYDPSLPKTNEVIAGNGTVKLEAARADIGGFTAGFDDKNPPAVCGWEDVRDSVTWLVRFDKAGKYGVAVEIACTPGEDGSRYGVSLAGNRLEADVPAGKDWEDYMTKNIGTLQVPKPGVYPLTVQGIAKKHKFVMNLRSVTLTPETSR